MKIKTNITRISTIGDTDNQIIIETGGKKKKKKKGKLTRAEMAGLDTPGKRRKRLEQLIGKKLPDVFVHKNRDGSYAVATGKEPTEWPEGTLPVVIDPDEDFSDPDDI